MRKIGVNINSNKTFNRKSFDEIVAKLREIFEFHEIEVFKDSIGLDGERAASLEFIIVFGGDGTILRTARSLGDNDIPILGINIGNLGFLTNAEITDFDNLVYELYNLSYDVEERTMFSCEITDSGEKCVALNDIVLAKGTLSRIVQFEIYINDKFYTNCTADGIIVSTPTGSTAYNLSAGGPIVHPELEVVAITPICPHTLSMRTLVVGADSNIKLCFKNNEESVFLTVDGQQVYELEGSQNILIKKHEKKCKVIKLRKNDYFEILRNKIMKKNI